MILRVILLTFRTFMRHGPIRLLNIAKLIHARKLDAKTFIIRRILSTCVYYAKYLAFATPRKAVVEIFRGNRACSYIAIRKTRKRVLTKKPLSLVPALLNRVTRKIEDKHRIGVEFLKYLLNGFRRFVRPRVDHDLAMETTFLWQRIAKTSRHKRHVGRRFRESPEHTVLIIVADANR